MGLFVRHPLLALLPALALAALWLWRRRAPALIACIAWLAYCAYEWAMQARVLCSGDCNIRIDLLLILPLLLALSLWALIASLRQRRPIKSTSP